MMLETLGIFSKMILLYFKKLFKMQGTQVLLSKFLKPLFYVLIFIVTIKNYFYSILINIYNYQLKTFFLNLNIFLINILRFKIYDIL